MLPCVYCYRPTIAVHQDQPLLCVHWLLEGEERWGCSKEEPPTQTWGEGVPYSHRAAEGAHHCQYSTFCRENWSRASSKARHAGLVFFWKYWGLSSLLFSQLLSLSLMARKFLSVACFPPALVLLIFKNKNKIKQATGGVYNDADTVCFTQWTTETELSTRLSKLFISLDCNVLFLHAWNLYVIWCIFQVTSAKMILHSLLSFNFQTEPWWKYTLFMGGEDTRSSDRKGTVIRPRYFRKYTGFSVYFLFHCKLRFHYKLKLYAQFCIGSK